jgi:hypothetical protein
MARRQPKIPRTIAFNIPFELDSSDWERIERAYGQSLSPKVRDAVVRITKDFLCWASAEETPPLRDAQKRAKSLRKHAASLLEEMQRTTGNEVGPYTDELIGLYFRRFWFEEYRREAEVVQDALPPEVVAALSIFLRACDGALSEMDALSTKIWMWQDREAWDVWIVELTGLLKAEDLPTAAAATVSNDKVSYSPFVRFIEQLQNGVPVGRSQWSSVALIEAIKRARRSRNKFQAKPQP